MNLSLLHALSVCVLLISDSYQPSLFQILIPIPVAGGIIGGVVGGVFGSILASTLAKKATAKVYDINLCEKCPLCPKYV